MLEKLKGKYPLVVDGILELLKDPDSLNDLDGTYVETLPDGGKVLTLYGQDDIARVFYKVKYELEIVLIPIIKWMNFPGGFETRL